MECVFEPGQVYKTRGGYEAKIYCTDAPGIYAVHGRIGGCIASWTPSGVTRVGETSASDLIPPAPPRIRERWWCNVSKSGNVCAFRTPATAAHFALADKPQRTAVPCMLIEIVDGEPGA